MEVTFLGTGSAMPTSNRMQSGLLVTDDDRSLLVDCGSGILHRLANTDGGYESISTVLLTHHHLDHVADLLPLLKARWLAGTDHLEVVGPLGTKALLDGLLDVHEYLAGRVDLQIRELVADETVSVAGFGVETGDIRHSMDGLAYRIGPEETHPRFGVSGDTEAFAGLARFFEGCRVVAHDCSFPDSVDVDGHPTPTEVGRAFADSSVDQLILTHLYPHTDGNHDAMQSAITDEFDGEVRFAHDGLTVALP